jgi:hypothetical protein
MKRVIAMILMLAMVTAIALSGGSAYGLGAANGVMEYLEAQGIGYDTGFARVPLVAQSDLFDLTVGDPYVRPDAAMGYAAARLALEAPNFRDGNYGVGCGVTVGKAAGMACCMKSGIGSYAVEKNVRIICTTQCVYDGTYLDTYEIGIMAMQKGAISAGRLHPELLVPAVMLALAQRHDRAALEIYLRNVEEKLFRSEGRRCTKSPLPWNVSRETIDEPCG